MPGVGFIRPAGGGGAGGGSVSVAAYSDAGFTTPITSADVGDTVYLKAVASNAPVEYLFFFEDLNGTITEIYKGAADNTSWAINEEIGVGSIYAAATEDLADPKDWVLNSVQFEVTGIDPDAFNWLQTVGFASDGTVYNSTYGITGADLYTALDAFYVALKAQTGLYEACHWMYLYFGSDANKSKINLVDPQDTDAAFRVDWNGGWLFNDEGRISNGSNTYGDTHFNALTHLSPSDGAYFGYFRTQPSGTAVSQEWGAFSASNPNNSNVLLRKTTADRSFYSLGYLTEVNGISVADLDGFNCITRDNNANLQKWIGNDGSVINSNTNAFTNHPNFNEYLGARNQSGSPTFYQESGSQTALEGRFDGLSDAQVSALRTAVINLMTALGWNV